VANLLPAGIFLPLRPFLNALQIFLEQLDKSENLVLLKANVVLQNN
jgi:hypothetical protein